MVKKYTVKCQDPWTEKSDLDHESKCILSRETANINSWAIWEIELPLQL